MKKLATGVFVSKACKNLRASAAFARDMRPAASALFVAPRSKMILALLLIPTFPSAIFTVIGFYSLDVPNRQAPPIAC